MQLSDIEYLWQEDLDNASVEIAAIVQSFLATTPLGALRYSAIPPDELRQWLTKGIRAELEDEARYPRIRWINSKIGNRNAIRWESLVIRDHDLEPLTTSDKSKSSTSPGRIVAHAAFMYHPPNEDQVGHEEGQQVNADLSEESNPLPASGLRELHSYWNNAVETALKAQFGGMHCFEVRELHVLSPTHWRKGIASKLMNWIIPKADRLNVSVVLAATPDGYPLYLKHGFAEVGGPNEIVECNMAEWGGSGVHRHVLMIRKPGTAEARKPEP